jgi:hypothetical protein
MQDSLAGYHVPHNPDGSIRDFYSAAKRDAATQPVMEGNGFLDMMNGKTPETKTPAATVPQANAASRLNYLGPNYEAM